MSGPRKEAQLLPEDGSTSFGHGFGAAVDEDTIDRKINELLSLLSGGRVTFVLSFNANSNSDPQLFRRVRRKAVDLQIQVISTREEAEAVLLCARS